MWLSQRAVLGAAPVHGASAVPGHRGRPADDAGPASYTYVMSGTVCVHDFGNLLPTRPALASQYSLGFPSSALPESRNSAYHALQRALGAPIPPQHAAARQQQSSAPAPRRVSGWDPLSQVPEVCAHNAAAAAAARRPEAHQAWNLLSLAVGLVAPDAGAASALQAPPPPPPPPPPQCNDDDAGSAAVLVSADAALQAMALPPPPAGYVPPARPSPVETQALWDKHPLGQPLVSKLFGWFEASNDVQTLASMACVLRAAPVPVPGHTQAAIDANAAPADVPAWPRAASSTTPRNAAAGSPCSPARSSPGGPRLGSPPRVGSRHRLAANPSPTSRVAQTPRSVGIATDGATSWAGAPPSSVHAASITTASSVTSLRSLHYAALAGALPGLPHSRSAASLVVLPPSVVSNSPPRRVLPPLTANGQSPPAAFEDDDRVAMDLGDGMDGDQPGRAAAAAAIANHTATLAADAFGGAAVSLQPYQSQPGAADMADAAVPAALRGSRLAVGSPLFGGVHTTATRSSTPPRIPHWTRRVQHDRTAANPFVGRADGNDAIGDGARRMAPSTSMSTLTRALAAPFRGKLRGGNFRTTHSSGNLAAAGVLRPPTEVSPSPSPPPPLLTVNLKMDKALRQHYVQPRPAPSLSAAHGRPASAAAGGGGSGGGGAAAAAAAAAAATAPRHVSTGAVAGTAPDHRLGDTAADAGLTASSTRTTVNGFGGGGGGGGGGELRVLSSETIQLLPSDLWHRAVKYVQEYANLLDRWGFRHARVEMLKLAAPAKRSLPSGLEVWVNCRVCLQPCRSGLCTECKVWALQCSVCQVSVRGLCTLCPFCGHGGHTAHLADWFGAGEETCPTGCGCPCVLMGLRVSRAIDLQTRLEGRTLDAVSVSASVANAADVLAATPSALLDQSVAAKATPAAQAAAAATAVSTDVSAGATTPSGATAHSSAAASTISSVLLPGAAAPPAFGTAARYGQMGRR